MSTTKNRPSVPVDREIAPRKKAEEIAERECTDESLVTSGEEVSELRKVYYPAYVVEYKYTIDNRISETKHGTSTVLLDGFYVTTSHDEEVHEYSITIDEISREELDKKENPLIIAPKQRNYRQAAKDVSEKYEEKSIWRRWSEEDFRDVIEKELVYFPAWVAIIKKKNGLERLFAFREDGSGFIGNNIDEPYWIKETISENVGVLKAYYEDDIGYHTGVGRLSDIRVDGDGFIIETKSAKSQEPDMAQKRDGTAVEDGFSFSDKDYSPEEAKEAVQHTDDGNEQEKKSTEEGPSESTDEEATTGGVDGTKKTSRETQPRDSVQQTPTPPTPEDTEYVTRAPDAGFRHVGGMEDLKESLQNKVIQPIENPGKYEEYGLNTVNGVLLYGPPGTGKTYLSRALAGELGYNYAEINPSDLVSSRVGELPNKIANVFEEARRYQPTVVFIDEIDSIAAERSDNDARTENQGVNQLLQELSQLNETDDDVVVIAATNKPDSLDPALLRNGRLDIKEEVPNPDTEARAVILYKHLEDRPTREGIDWEELAQETEGMSAADLEAVAEQAAFEALQNDEKIHHKHLQEAIGGTEEGTDVSIDTDLLDPTPDMDFRDVGGMSELKEQLRREVIEPVENPEKFEEYGLDTTNGVLLYGPPGTGKTYMSKALAGEMDMNYAKIEPDDILSKWVNESAENVGEIFDKARENAPCLVFIDELDAVASERGGKDKHQDQDNTVNQLLNELSEINEGEEDVVVVAATNNLDGVDEAAKRSGRFDKKVEVPEPGVEARREILKVQLRSRPTSEDVDLQRVARETEGMVGSDLELLVEKAARRAMYDEGDIRTEHLVEAADSV